MNMSVSVSMYRACFCDPGHVGLSCPAGLIHCHADRWHRVVSLRRASARRRRRPKHVKLDFHGDLDPNDLWKFRVLDSERSSDGTAGLQPMRSVIEMHVAKHLSVEQ